MKGELQAFKVGRVVKNRTFSYKGLTAMSVPPGQTVFQILHLFSETELCLTALVSSNLGSVCDFFMLFLSFCFLLSLSFFCQSFLPPYKKISGLIIVTSFIRE